MESFKFIKYWGYFYLDSQYWVNIQYYFYFICYKTKIIDYSFLKLMAMPDIFFKIFFKFITPFVFSSLTLILGGFGGLKKKYNFFKNKNYYIFYQFFNMYSSLLISNFIFLFSFKTKNFSITSQPSALYYVNYNIFSILFFFKFKYFLHIKYPFKYLSLIRNSMNLFGLGIK